jgi:DHA3 family tetracycline resistance protein-like MFS transporter
MHRLPPFRVYLFMAGADAILRNTMYVTLAVYYVLAVHMNAFQLVLAGTTLEVVYFVCQMPTGLFADLYSRRLSMVLGWTICGACFAAEGLLAQPLAILIAQGVLGLGEAFLTGAQEAWLVDELGQDRLGEALRQGSQIGQICSLLGIVAGVALASIRLNLPVAAGGVLMLVVGGVLCVIMPEDRWQPAPRGEGSVMRNAARSLRTSVGLVRGSRVLITLLVVEVFDGGAGEAFDRLWEAHLIRDISLPAIGPFQPLVWFALIAAGGSVVGLVTGRLMKHRLGPVTQDPEAMARWLLWLNFFSVACIVAFALAPSLALALAALLLRGMAGVPTGLINAVWMNSEIPDPRVRATVLSLQGQCNALGQWTGGPALGFIGTVVSLPAAIAATGLLRLPISALYWRMRRERIVTARFNVRRGHY